MVALHFLLSLLGFSSAVVIDRFASRDSNALGNWHGCDEGEGITCTWATNKLTIRSTDVDYSFYTQFNDGCQDITNLNSQYLHVKITGSDDFTISLQQHNAGCNEAVAPFPETWDSVYARDYNVNGDIYIPMSHFNIIKTRAIGLAFKAFRSTTSSTVFTLVETVTSLPSGRTAPAKKPTGTFYFQCTRPNSLAFGIDDGEPSLAQRTMQIIKDAGIKVTFFTTGSALLDTASNFTNVYKEAIARGHQVALHSMTHPKLESLPVAQINDEFTKSLNAAKQTLGDSVTTKYFRPPYGTEGALTRQRVEAAVGGGSKVINWSVDIEDWLWGESDTPQKQLDAVKRDLGKGGNLFVAHYLYESTVQYLPEFIQLAKATGKQIMRVDQCMEDPNAPPL